MGVFSKFAAHQILTLQVYGPKAATDVHRLKTKKRATSRTRTTRPLSPKRENPVTSTLSFPAVALLLRTGRRDGFCESEKRKTNVHVRGKLTLKRGFGLREANIPPSFSVITNLCVANCGRPGSENTAGDFTYGTTHAAI